MKRLLLVTLSCGLVLGGWAARAASLGDPAPALSIERWIKGSPVKIAPGNNLFVIEFWATWCPPCKRSIPHLTELQKKYAKQGVIIVGISDESATEVTPFVSSQGENMAYRVAIDTSKRSMNTWYAAYGAKGLPHAFIVDTNGCVIWHGFPSEELGEALEDITTGKYNLEREKNLEMGDRLVTQYLSWVSQPKPLTNAPALGGKILSDYTQDWRIAYRLSKGILTEPGVRSRDVPL
ncbi:MAG TPA: TlpA disulfide reductase family protein, partial [Clostridia bacterium]|nr:TlpA disulfide reductase family protein [Clostridia bacterium]